MERGIESAKDGDRLVGSVESGVLPDRETAHAGQEIAPRRPELGNLDETQDRRIEGGGVGIPSRLAPGLEGVP